MDKIRALRADEVECRVAQVTQKGCSLLLYKDARCDKRILDETFGIYGWENGYDVVNGNLYCTISVYDKDTQQWINKQDCGVESNTEKQKGEASDAFKRASFNWGIGRELYTKIFIWLSVETVQDANKKWKLKNPFEKWHVKEMVVDNKNEKITKLVIADKNGVVAFTYTDGKTTMPKATTTPKATKTTEMPPQTDFNQTMENIPKASDEQINGIKAGCLFTGKSEDTICKHYGVTKIEELTAAQATAANHKLILVADKMNTGA